MSTCRSMKVYADAVEAARRHDDPEQIRPRHGADVDAEAGVDGHGPGRSTELPAREEKTLQTG